MKGLEEKLDTEVIKISSISPTGGSDKKNSNNKNVGVHITSGIGRPGHLPEQKMLFLKNSREGSDSSYIMCD